ncbi:MAG TPA: Crp/Fnr family transcriptional regulator [Bacteroidales bacterium]|nr:Crp/Fnr family transcriptional regulator [Bacteroidales bacterium]
MRKNKPIDISESLPDIWRILNEEEHKLIRESARFINLSKNEIVYYENDKPVDFMCLLKGKIKIYKEGVGGRSQIVRVVRPVQYFGYRAYFAEEPYVTTAAAFESSVVCLIPMKIIEQILRNNGSLAMLLIRLLSIDLGVSDRRVVNLTQKHIRGRLAESLIFLKESYGLEEDGATIGVYLAREDLANLSNMTTSNAIRTLSIFEKERIISLDGRKIKIIDEDRLQKISRIG